MKTGLGQKQFVVEQSRHVVRRSFSGQKFGGAHANGLLKAGWWPEFEILRHAGVGKR